MSEKVEKNEKPIMRQVTLKRSGIVASIPEDWELADNQHAQRQAKGDGSAFQWYLMQRVCLFDGETWTLPAIKEKIKGKDALQLTGEFFGDEDGDDTGNE